MSIITFISDFGLKDHYVSSVKASIIKYNQNIKIVDISHNIRKYDISHAAHVFKNVYEEFPNGSIHIISVKHDNNERLRRLLEINVIKRRNRRNAITFFGQFCSFAFEFSFGIAILCAVKGHAPWIAVFILKALSFTSMSIVEVLTSSSLRPRIFKF